MKAGRINIDSKNEKKELRFSSLGPHIFIAKITQIGVTCPTFKVQWNVMALSRLKGPQGLSQTLDALSWDRTGKIEQPHAN